MRKTPVVQKNMNIGMIEYPLPQILLLLLLKLLLGTTTTNTSLLLLLLLLLRCKKTILGTKGDQGPRGTKGTIGTKVDQGGPRESLVPAF